MKRNTSLYTKLYYLSIILIVIAILIVALIFYNTRKNMNQSNLDRYNNFQELKTNTKEYKNWRIVTKERKHHDILVTAIHGGGIEPGTTELARRISNVGHYDFYSFEGLRKKNNDQLHITSTNYDEPKLHDMLKNAEQTVSIHGFSGDDPIVFVGGKDKKMAKSIAKSLRHKGFTVKKSPNEIDAKSSKNFVNENENDSGVQLELTTKQREQFFKNHKLSRQVRSNPDNYTKTFYQFTNAVQDGVKKAKES